MRPQRILAGDLHTCSRCAIHHLFRYTVSLWYGATHLSQKHQTLILTLRERQAELVALAPWCFGGSAGALGARRAQRGGALVPCASIPIKCELQVSFWTRSFLIPCTFDLCLVWSAPSGLQFHVCQYPPRYDSYNVILDPECVVKKAFYLGLGMVMDPLVGIFTQHHQRVPPESHLNVRSFVFSGTVANLGNQFGQSSRNHGIRCANIPAPLLKMGTFAVSFGFPQHFGTGPRPLVPGLVLSAGAGAGAPGGFKRVGQGSQRAARGLRPGPESLGVRELGALAQRTCSVFFLLFFWGGF